MAIETDRYSHGVTKIRMTACPFCGYEFGHGEERGEHFLFEHGPADAGLSPLGRRSV